jgi:MFS transporter, SP family, xylose:H+ symportor
MHGPVAMDSVADAQIPLSGTGYIWGLAISAALGGLLFGYDWVVIGGARQFYESYFNLSSSAQVGWANSCALLGCLLGSLTAGGIAERYGRKPVLLLSAVLFAVSSILTGWSFSFTSFILWRVIGGVAIGLASNVSPLYIAEISPAALRGRLVSLNQFAIVVGILLAQIINWIIARPIPLGLSSSALQQTWNFQYGWRWMFSAVVVPALCFAVAAILLPESPRWLINRKRDAEAVSTLQRIGGKPYAAAEFDRIRSSYDQSVESSSWKELLGPGTRRVFFIAIALAVLQQWTGINILFNYASEIYRSAGYGSNDIFLNIVITGSINLIFTVLAMFLVDSLGRRKLMLLGCIGIALCHLLCAWAYMNGKLGAPVLVLTLGAIGCYALTLAPVTWVLIAEIFPNRVRSQGIAGAVSALWIASFALTYTFPSINSRLGTGGAFISYGMICLMGAVLVFLGVPETRGYTLEQIEAASRTESK